MASKRSAAGSDQELSITDSPMTPTLEPMLPPTNLTPTEPLMMLDLNPSDPSIPESKPMGLPNPEPKKEEPLMMLDLNPSDPSIPESKPMGLPKEEPSPQSPPSPPYSPSPPFSPSSSPSPSPKEEVKPPPPDSRESQASFAGGLWEAIDIGLNYEDSWLRQNFYPSRERNWDYGPISSTIPANLYRITTIGAIDEFQREIQDRRCRPLEQLSPRGNTVLHVAASLGHNNLVKLILYNYPGLAESVNEKGDLALHVAASCGHLSTVKSLARPVNSSTPGTSAMGETEVDIERIKKGNNEGKTALQVALENHHEEVASFLVEKGPPVEVNYENREKMSPLYFAAKAGYSKIVKLIIDKRPDKIEEEKSKGKPAKREEKGKGKSVERPRCESSLLHDAVMGRNKSYVLDAILKKDPAIIKSFDESGRSPLSLAAYIGYFDGVCCLLNKSNYSTVTEESTYGPYLRDSNGFFPIHTASSVGNIKIVREILDKFPDSAELILNEQGQNILHVAAVFGKAKLVSYMLKKPELAMLINERDKEGNTPLHLATKFWHPKVVSILTWNKKVCLNIVNNKGQTAMDVTKSQTLLRPDMTSFRQRLTLFALKSANVPQSKRWSSQISTKPEYPYHVGPMQFQERANILLFVSTLIATVTFAAGFTMPGGYNNSGVDDEGMATLSTKPAFRAFLICNTIAMYSSITVAVTLIWAQLGDINLMLTAFNFALPFLGVALMMMSATFMAAVYLVVSNHNWLANVVITMGSVFIFILLAIFISLYFPLRSSHFIARYISYYPFCLIAWAAISENDKEINNIKEIKGFEHQQEKCLVM